MPIIWRYLYKQFFKVFTLTTLSFIFILLATRLREIAKFIALSPHIKYVLAFILNIVPFILPIAIPIACLLSSVILFKKLSQSHELTALRCSGYSLFSVIFPVLFVSLFLSLLNFFIVSEMTSHSQVYSHKLINELITNNPFYLLENRRKLKMKDFFVDMNIEDRGKVAKNVLIITPDKRNEQFNLMSVEKLGIEAQKLKASIINGISIIDSKDPYNHDTVVLENENNVSSSVTELTEMMHKTHMHLQPEHLTMPFLKIRLRQKHKRLSQAYEEKDPHEISINQKDISLLRSEIARRVSIGFSVLTFTLIGISFSIKIGRSIQRKNFVILSGATIFGLVCFFVGKMFHTSFYIACLIYAIPHVISNFLSIWNLNRTMRGLE